MKNGILRNNRGTSVRKVQKAVGNTTLCNGLLQRGVIFREQHSTHHGKLSLLFMFAFPCIISLYYIKNQQDATLAVLFISNCKVTLHV